MIALGTPLLERILKRLKLRPAQDDTELLWRDEIDDRNLIGLSSVVTITHSVVNGTSLLTKRILNGFDRI